MKLSGWGNYPISESVLRRFGDVESLQNFISESDGLIARGNGRSYGDSSLGSQVVDIRRNDLFLGFDETTGVLHVQAGALLAEILDVFVPRGWFLAITPGTKLITVGGAIASDVHGKNHHVAGCFSECVESFDLVTATGDICSCSRAENKELFLATCGGMGLTGIIISARIRLQRINSSTIIQTTVKSRDLDATLAAFEDHAAKTYSVAWIDCLARGGALGRSILTAGDFGDDGKFEFRSPKQLGVPGWFPSVLVNRLSARAFNGMYFGKVREHESDQSVGIDSFFYPLDAIDNWNRVYGRRGFVQYQFVLPKKESPAGIEEILSAASRSRPGSFLAVIKLCGPGNDNLMSFPIEGYSVALDFKVVDGLFAHLETLDELVMKYAGRIYLTKDARAKSEVIAAGYPRLEEFRALRKERGMDRKFVSLQSQRLEI